VPRFDPIALTEALYQWPSSNDAWLSGIAHAARGLDLGGGILTYTLHFGGEAIDFAAGHHETAEYAARVPEWVKRCPRPVTALANVPLGRVRKGGEALARENARRAGMSLEEYGELMGDASRMAPDASYVIGGSGADRCAMVLLAKPRRVLGVAHRHYLETFVAHFVGMTRLRRLLGAAPDSGSASNAAVLDPKGRLLHATPDAQVAATSLTRAVLGAEKARGKLRRVDPAEAQRKWLALVEGEYSIVETVERDGKRFLLARKNPHRIGPLGRLTSLEVACAYHTALGHSQKFIAYELGVSLSRAVRATESAVRKLRLRNKEELVRALSHVLREPADG
jgi:DNA-binding CsgD family transcriptional regulator